MITNSGLERTHFLFGTYIKRNMLYTTTVVRKPIKSIHLPVTLNVRSVESKRSDESYATVVHYKISVTRTKKIINLVNGGSNTIAVRKMFEKSTACSHLNFR